MAKKPKAPSGLSIGRDGNRFGFGWSRPAKYTKQDLYYQINKSGKNKITVNGSTTGKVATINLNNYYPKTETNLTSVRFFVKGYKSKWSDYANKEMVIGKPPKPELIAELSSDNDHTTTFSWAVDFGEDYDKASTPKIVKNFQWWTSLLPDSDLDSDQITEWQETGTSDDDVDSGYKVIDESNVFADNYSYTRYFKIVARGPAGDSDPSYAKHVYAFPNPAQNVKAYSTKLETGQGVRVSVQWTAESTKARPIDYVDVEYAIAVPDSSYSDEDGVRKAIISIPNISSWTTATTIQDTSISDTGDVNGAAFSILENLEDDECIFVRIVTVHDSKSAASDIVLVENSFANLAEPSGLSATIDSDHLATVSVANNSDVAASFVGIYYRNADDTTPQLVGISPAGNSSAITVQLPNGGEADISLGARTFLADYSPINPALTGVTNYALGDPIMASKKIVWDERPVPKPPEFTLASPRTGVVRVTWNWTWTSANGVEISWADHDDAWESTDGPSSYTLENTRASAWNIAGLDVGTWYFKVRLFKYDADGTTYGTYSEIKSIKLASTPATPVLTLSPSVVQPDGKVTCYWAFSATDGDDQAHAEIREVTLDSSGAPETYIDIGVKADNEQYKTIDISSLDWEAGTTHYLAVKVITLSGEESNNWSLPKPIQILEPITAEITSTSLSEITVVDDEDQGISHTQLSLTSMPLTVTAIGAGDSGTMNYILERATDYHLDRPDESEVSGFEGETIAIVQKSPTNVYSATEDTEVVSAKQYYIKDGDIYTPVTPEEGSDPSALGYYEISSYNYTADITMDDLIGPLDDNAPYNLIAIAQDSYGQTAQAILKFEVHWAHKAVEPSATIETDKDEMVTFITPIQPSSGYVAGDTCDIYRLSIDKPELIVQNADFGTKYVDPYPALGKMGGHRIVYKTSTGSYITDTDNEFAWTDYDNETGDILDVFATIIDFSEEQIVLPYDLSLSNKWAKDFTTTKYLGGSVEGDWNPAVTRTGTVKTRVAVQYDSDVISQMRRLANYAGICHVRTPDGSSFAANVNVTEDREEKKINMLASFTLDISKVDSEGFDGVTYDDWHVE